MRRRANFPPDSPADPVRPAPLRGPALWPARAVWAGVALLALIAFVTSLPPTVTFFATPCHPPACEWVQLSDAGMTALAAAGIPRGAYVAYMLGIIVVFALGYFAVAAVIAWRHSAAMMPLLASLFLVTFGASFPANVSGPLMSTVSGVSLALLGLLLYLFPDGRFVPRWTRGAAGVWILAQIPFTLVGPTSVANADWALTLRAALLMLALASMLFAQVYRYRRVSGPEARRQTKWVVYGFAFALLTFPLLVGVYALQAPATLAASPLESVLLGTVFYLPWLGIPVAFGMAILRARLWDIDVIIRRTLVYVSLTGTLLVVYVGGVVFLQAALAPLTGQARNDLAIVASTLAIVALFTPLRRRIQATIDRRFYRQKYDAGRTLAGFAAGLRHEDDLEVLSGRLVAVVEETMQPAHVALWLRRSDVPAVDTARDRVL